MPGQPHCLEAGLRPQRIRRGARLLGREQTRIEPLLDVDRRHRDRCFALDPRRNDVFDGFSGGLPKRSEAGGVFPGEHDAVVTDSSEFIQRCEVREIQADRIDARSL